MKIKVEVEVAGTTLDQLESGETMRVEAAVLTISDMARVEAGQAAREHVAKLAKKNKKK